MFTESNKKKQAKSLTKGDAQVKISRIGVTGF
jgi:hypothetical protein